MSLPGTVLIHLTYLHDRSLPGSVLIHLTYLHDRSLPGSLLIPLTYLHGMSLPGSVLIHLTYCLAWYRIFNKKWHLYWMLKCENVDIYVFEESPNFKYENLSQL
jgi:hypothetical protein